MASASRSRLLSTNSTTAGFQQDRTPLLSSSRHSWRRRETPDALVLAAHGTRDPRGVAELQLLARAVGDRLRPASVSIGYVDVLGPSVAEVLSSLAPGSRAVVVPAFLAAGYHVRVDVPQAITASNTHRVRMAPALGADPLLVQVAVSRLMEAGAQHGDAVVMVAAGSSDPRARSDTEMAARLLSAQLAAPVEVGFIGTGVPAVTDVVARIRQCGARRVAVASWLLAPGLFHRRLADVGAEVVAAPLGAHPFVIRTVVNRYRAALAARTA
jgi:sirohydrochlorin ferrochelatase